MLRTNPTNEVVVTVEEERFERAGGHISNIVAVIPAYNEARFIGSVVLKAYRFADVVIVVDDGSKDETAEIAELAGAVVIRHEINQGKGEALNTGFQKARELFMPNAIVTLDADWQHLPEDLPKVVAPILTGEADIVIGSRYLDKTSDVPLQRVIGHWGFTTIINVTSGTPVTDSQSGFRAFTADATRDLMFSSKGFGVETEMQFVATDRNLRVREVPITIRYVDKPKRSLLLHGWKVLNGLLRLVSQHRPLMFFTTIGLTVLVLGTIMGMWAIQAQAMTQQIPAAQTILAILFCVAGTVSLATGIILHTLRAMLIQFTSHRRTE